MMNPMMSPSHFKLNQKISMIWSQSSDPRFRLVSMFHPIFFLLFLYDFVHFTLHLMYLIRYWLYLYLPMLVVAGNFVFLPTFFRLFIFLISLPFQLFQHTFSAFLPISSVLPLPSPFFILLSVIWHSPFIRCFSYYFPE